MRMQAEAYTVSHITALIRQNLEETFFEVWVEGEVSDLRVPSSGHIYFILKDERAQLKCVLFKGSQRFIRFMPEDGLKVLARGNITVYEARGEYQLICDYMEPLGSGVLQLAFEQLKKRLEKEGLFDKRHKRPLPFWPRRIGIVTSITGAAVKDILNILTRRFPTMQVLINPVRVQGEGAADEIAQAIRELEVQPEIDVIIITRGGGSLEDLWAFNEEVVARAIYLCKVPVISAVGHEIDFTISDFVADVRAPTPSAAAEIVIQSRDIFEDQLNGLQRRLIRLFRSRFEMDSMRLQHLTGHKFFRKPIDIILGRQERIDDQEVALIKAFRLYTDRLEERVVHASLVLGSLHPAQRIKELLLQMDNKERRLVETISVYIKMVEKSLEGFMFRLDSLSPLKVLQRGYSLCWRLPDGRLLKQISQISLGDLIRVRFYKGEAICEVKRKDNTDEGE